MVLVLLFFGGWYFTWYFEGEREIATPEVFWWYFLVTGTTVGYGDFSPVTTGGRLTSLVIMVGMIGFMAAMVGKIADSVLNLSRWRLRGMFNVHMENHIVIFGYRRGETERIVDEIRGDAETSKLPIVLCSSSLEENPAPRDVEFVHGKLTSQDVLQRSCVAKSARVIIHGGSDDQTLAVGIAVNHVTGPETHIVAFFQDPSNLEYLLKVNPAIECVHSLAVPMLVQALQDPGSTQVIRKITSNLEAGTQYRLDIPDDLQITWAFGDLLSVFKERYNSILIGLAQNHAYNADVVLNPDRNQVVSAGMSLFYIAGSRIRDSIYWDHLAKT